METKYRDLIEMSSVIEDAAYAVQHSFPEPSDKIYAVGSSKCGSSSCASSSKCGNSRASSVSQSNDLGNLEKNL